MDNLLPQTLKSRLLIPDYDSSDNSDKDVVHKEYVDGKTFTLNVSKGLDMKGNKVINIADPTSATDGSNARHVNTKTSNYLKTDGTRVMTGNLNMNNRSISNAKQAQSYESTRTAYANFVNTTINNNNTLMTTNYHKYVHYILNQSFGSTDLKNTIAYIINKSGQFSDEDNIKEVKFIKKDSSVQ